MKPVSHNLNWLLFEYKAVCYWHKSGSIFKEKTASEIFRTLVHVTHKLPSHLCTLHAYAGQVDSDASLDL